MENILAKLTEWFPVITSFVGSFAILATVTPNKTDNKIAQFLMDIINFFGGNIGKSENK